MERFLSPLAILLLAGASAATAQETAPRPNILYFYVDDMGWGSIGPNGQAERRARNLPTVRTPNLDRLAARGITFTRAYGCTVCSPARSSQQTGFHQGHTFADRNDPDNAKKAMRADDLTMGDLLSVHGYVTGYWGKWGYGGSKDQENPTLDNLQTLPSSHGYQHVLAELHHVRAHTFFQPTLWSAPAPASTPGGLILVPNSMAPYQQNPSFPNEPALQNHPDYPATAYCDDVYAFRALEFIRRQASHYNSSGQPFFGLLAVQIPHAPFREIEALPEWDLAYRDDPHFADLADQSRQWAAMVTRIDAHFGHLLEALEDPNGDGNSADSVSDNTLVIFMSDNGGPRGKNNEEFDANGGLRGNKGSIYEGGIRVPTIMSWPARITSETSLQAGGKSDRLVDVSDLLPTFCELAGATPPLGLDGVSLAPTLLGAGHQRIRDFLIHEAGNNQSIIRGHHKLIRTQSKKTTSFALYDLERDHAESQDIASEHPELVAELKALLLGERVAEPRGFANTYHHWTGSNGAVTSDANNWSDYEYSNAGITYLEDRGAPRPSWTARMENGGKSPAVAQVDADLEVLALEIRGAQELKLRPGTKVTGRNEIRLSAGATLRLNGGTAESLRWLEVHPKASLLGPGVVNATLYSAGTLELPLPKATDPALQVAGEVHLAGQLSLSLPSDWQPQPGQTFTAIQALSIEGRFDHGNDEVVTSEGLRFLIGYQPEAVTLTLKEAPGS